MDPVSKADSRTRLRALGEELFTTGIGGDITAGKAFLGRAYGQPKQRTLMVATTTAATLASVSSDVRASVPTT